MGLLKIHNGSAALQLIRNGDEKWQGNRRAHSMIVLKRKSTLEFKARLVLRGDTVLESEVSSPSASTACRGSVQCALSMATIFSLSVSIIDVSQAFLQSDEMAHKDKVVVAVPSYISLPGPETLKRMRKLAFQ